MFNRLSIRSREIATVVILIIGFVIVGVFVLGGLQAIERNAGEVADLAEQQAKLGKIQAALDSLTVQLEQLQSDPTLSSSAANTIGLTLEELTYQFEDLNTLNSNNRSLYLAYTRFQQVRTAIDEKLIPETESGSFEMVANLSAQQVDDVRNLSGRLQVAASQLDAEEVELIEEADRLTTAATARTLIALGGLAVIATGILISNMQAITSGILTLTDGAQKLAEGQSGEVIKFSKGRADEFAHLGQHFNMMGTAIRSQRYAIQNQIAALEEARTIAEAATERKSAFLANMSHELRAPMHIIQNFTKLVLDGETGSLNEDQREFLNRVMTSSHHLLDVINDVLDMARIEAGEIEINPVPLDLGELLDDMKADAQALITEHEKDIVFEVELLPNLPKVFADETRVRQILLNLVANAIRFTDEGGVKITFGKGVYALTICVEDTGVGIPPDKIGDIFDRFEQVSGNGYSKRGGTGLGLAIARDLVVLQGGRIWANSVLGEGSAFCFTLPLAEVDPVAAAKAVQSNGE